MNMNVAILSILVIVGVGCSSNEYRMGQSLSHMKMEQRYNPHAAQENADVVPQGHGERVEATHRIYADKSSETLKGSSSRVLDNQN